MTRFSYINQNIDRIKNETRMGIISTSIIRHYGIYARYDVYRQQGYSARQSAFYAGEDFKVEDRTVFRIIKNMEGEL